MEPTPSRPVSSSSAGADLANAPAATRREFLTALRSELPQALRLLQTGNVAPVDLAQAAIGPGMAVYTRYAKVLDTHGNPLPVRDALALINQTLDEVLAEQEGDFDADTRWAIAWIEQFGFDDGEYGVAETLSKAKNTSVGGLVAAGILASKGGKVRLLKPEELPDDWNPATDPRLTAWEMVHHLIRVLESGGESAAAELAADARRRSRDRSRAVLPPLHPVRTQQTRGRGTVVQRPGAELAGNRSPGTRRARARSGTSCPLRKRGELKTGRLTVLRSSHWQSRTTTLPVPARFPPAPCSTAARFR